MNAFICMEWVREHGGKQLDYTTNKHVVDWVVNTALEMFDDEESIELCKKALISAQVQIYESENGL
jgi:hypothetical protein